MSDVYTDTYYDTYGDSGGGGGGGGGTGDSYSDIYYDTYGEDDSGGDGGGGLPFPTPIDVGVEIDAGHDWRVHLYDPRALVPTSELQATAKSLTINLTEPSTCSFTLSGNDNAVGTVEEMISDTVWRRDGVDLVRLRVGASTDKIDANKHVVTFTGGDYRALLDRRFLTTTISTTAAPTGTEQFDIVWQMITQTQAVSGGNLGITQESGWASSGVARKDVWPVGTAIGEAITEMGNRRSVDGFYGFDWDISPALELHLYTPVRGATTGFVIQYGGNCDNVDRSVSSNDYANYVVTQWTDKTGNEKMAIAYSSDLGTRPEGLWEVWGGGSWATTGEGLAAAQGKLSSSQGMLPSYECHLTPGAWDPATCWVGDTVALTVLSGRLNITDVPYRVQAIRVDIKDDGSEDVTVTLGTPSYKIATQLWAYGRSITTLERR